MALLVATCHELCKHSKKDDAQYLSLAFLSFTTLSTSLTMLSLAKVCCRGFAVSFSITGTEETWNAYIERYTACDWFSGKIHDEPTYIRGTECFS